MKLKLRRKSDFLKRTPPLPSPKGREFSGNSLPFGEGLGGVLLKHIQNIAKLLFIV